MGALNLFKMKSVFDELVCFTNAIFHIDALSLGELEISLSNFYCTKTSHVF